MRWQRRVPLHYALEQRWCLDKLSWLVDRSLAVVLEKDTDVRPFTRLLPTSALYGLTFVVCGA